MSNNPDQIRADIERTRHELSADVDALAEKTSPTRAVHRQGDRVREGLTTIKESIMGSPTDPYSHSSEPGLADRAQEVAHDVQHRAEDAVHAVQQAPARVRRGTRGNPLAAGLIALGAGWLVGSLIPSSRVEQDTAEKVKDQAGPVVEQAKSMAQQVGEHLKPQAQDAVASVKDTAATGAEHVKAEGQDQADRLKDESTQAAQNAKEASQDT